MIDLTCIGTGSKGNCYLLNCDGQKLLLDCGLSVKRIKIGLNFDLSGIVGCLVTHNHKDHSLSALNVECMGIPVYKPYECVNQMRSKHFGDILVQSFPVPHDGVPCVGYIITYGVWKMLYATDFEYIPWHFDGMRINAMLIECNHQDEITDDLAENYGHVVRGHASLNVTRDAVVANTTDALTDVILCHLSEMNAYPAEMVKVIKSAVPDSVNVSIASRGECYKLLA